MDVSLGTFLKETKGDKYMYEEYVKEEKIFKSSVNEFNSSYILITTFINNLFVK